MNEETWLTTAKPEAMLDFVRSNATDRKLRLFACACCRRIWDLFIYPASRAAVEAAEMFADGLLTQEQRLAAFDRAVVEAAGWMNCCGPLDATIGGATGAAVWVAAETTSARRDAVDAGGSDVLTIADTALRRWRHPVIVAARDAAATAACSATAWAEAMEEGALEDAEQYPDEPEHSEWGSTVIRAGASRANTIGIRTTADFADSLNVQQQVQAFEDNAQCRLLRDVFGNPYRLAAIHPAWRTSTIIALASDIYQEKAFNRMPILAVALLDAGCDNADILDHCRDTSLTHVRGCWVVDLILGKE